MQLAHLLRHAGQHTLGVANICHQHDIPYHPDSHSCSTILQSIHSRHAHINVRYGGFAAAWRA